MSDVYLILYPQGQLGKPDSFSAEYTLDAVWASKCIDLGKRVFKLNNLTELKEVKVSYEEIPMELT